MSRLYFAYGLNMVVADMLGRCPGASLLGQSVLPGYRFVINRNGLASVVEDATRQVHGLLWEVTVSDEAALDHFEGLDHGLYNKASCFVSLNQEIIEAFLYEAQDRRPGRPRPGYLTTILAAGRQHRLPASYLRELEELQRDAAD